MDAIRHDVCALYNAPYIGDGKGYHTGCVEDGVIFAVEDGDSAPFAGTVCIACRGHCRDCGSFHRLIPAHNLIDLEQSERKVSRRSGHIVLGRTRE